MWPKALQLSLQTSWCWVEERLPCSRPAQHRGSGQHLGEGHIHHAGSAGPFTKTTQGHAWARGGHVFGVLF